MGIQYSLDSKMNGGLKNITRLRPLYVKLFKNLSGGRKKSLFYIAILTVTAMFFEIASIGAVIPFLTLMIDPSLLDMSSIQYYIRKLDPLITIKEPIVALGSCFILLSLMSGSIRYLLMSRQTHLVYSIGADLATQIYTNQLQKPFLQQIGENSSDVVSVVVTKTQDVVNQIILPIIILTTSSLILLGMISFLFLLHPLISLSMSCLLLLTYWIISITLNRRLLELGQTVSDLRNLSVLRLTEGLNGVREVILNDSLDSRVQLFESADRPMRECTASIIKYSQAPRYFVEAIAVSGIIACALYFSLIDKAYNILPLLGAMALSVQRMLPLVQQCHFSITQLKGGGATLSDLLKYLPDKDLETEKYRLFKQELNFTSQIETQALNVFLGEQRIHALSDVTLRIKRGEHIGITGRTGSGKTTLVDCLTGLIVPDTGKILIDETLLQRNNLRTWQSKIQQVPQNLFLIDDTIQENVLLDVEENSINWDWLKNVYSICAISGDDRYYENFNKDKIGEGGAKISGGQRQRVAIARALYKKPEFLILDEATSALDEKTEMHILSEISKKMPNLTIVSIAHKKNALKFCNRIIHLENGKVCSQQQKNL